MGYFDLPKGEVELRIDGVWQSVEFTDHFTREDYLDIVKRWSKNHTVGAARYNSHRYENEIPVYFTE